MKQKCGLLVLFHLITAVMISQTVDYYPVQKPEVSDDKYNHGIMILEETYKRVKRQQGMFDYADYWNLAIAYFVLKQEPEAFRAMLYKSKQLNPKNFSEIFLNAYFDEKNLNRWEGYLTAEAYSKLLEEAKAEVTKQESTSTIVTKDTSEEEDCYDPNLISTIKAINTKDQKFRSAHNRDLQKQSALDKENLQRIDSLYKQHQSYVGLSLVGPKYQHVMWSVIQHSNLQVMEKYLPVIFEAAKAGELQETLLYMLLDRIYVNKCGYQIYGTQASEPIGPAEEIKVVKDSYQLYPDSPMGRLKKHMKRKTKF